MATSAFANQEYTVGWISALPLEMAAARAMLDEVHGRPQEQHKSDHNTYILGRSGQHNIVIACLPAGVIGTTSAAMVTAQILSSFDSIRFGLMVGIGGGVPRNEYDIRLGDVVVSKPGNLLGGVVQYDSGKTIEGGRFTRTGISNKPPLILLNAVSGLEMEHMVEESKITQFLSEMLTKYPKMQTAFSYQGTQNDKLYQSDYDHIDHGKTCESCDASKISDRSPRCTNDPIIHYGVIASGSQLMRHGATRDRLSQELNIICFEMEAAGLIDNFPCLVIRGICDYADSHKNDRWQKYAAATAAAYAKELLSIIPASQVKTTPLVAEVLKMSENLSTIGREVNSVKTALKTARRDHYSREVLDWLTEVNYAAQCSDFLSRRQEGTGLWMLKSLEFNAWLNSSQKTLFLPGIPGSGKTMMASIVVQHLWENFPESSFPDHKVGIAVLYCSYKGAAEQRDVDLLSAFLKQLVQSQQSIPSPVKSLYDHHRNRETRPSSEEIATSLLALFDSFSQIFIVIDALDECRDDDGTRTKLLSRIRSFQTHSNVKFMATSRPILKIKQEFEDDIYLEVRASNEDVERYLDSQMARMPSCVSERPYLQHRVKMAISKAAQGMFLLARLYLDSLANKPTEKAINSALEWLPRGSEALHKAYDEVKERIDSQPLELLDLAKRVLSWITYAQRPLTILELQHALAVERSTEELDETNIPGVTEMVSVCAGLVTIDPETSIIRLVHYTTQEYFERIRETWLPDAPTDIAITCLTYLSFKTFSSGCSPTDEIFEERLTKNVFLRYAACYWADHTREIQVKMEEIALAFLQNTSLTSASSQAMVDLSFRYDGYSSAQEQTGLHLAARLGLQEYISRLLEYSKDAADIDPKNSVGENALSLAATNGHDAVVKLLIEKGADVESKDDDGQTPLVKAALNGHEAVMKLLIEKGADLESRDYCEQTTPLFKAAENGHEAVVRLLIEKGADLKSEDFNYQTPLFKAAKNGHKEVVKLLAEKGADLESRDINSDSPLSIAIWNRYEEVAKLLVEKGADFESEHCYEQTTPLFKAAENGLEALVKLFIEKGADLESWNCNGDSPLSIAIRNRHDGVVKLLVEKGVDLEYKVNGESLLSIAILNRYEEAVKLLIQNGATLNFEKSL